MPLATVEEILRLYQEQYRDFNVRHFHGKLREQHHIRLSYTWVKRALQMAGLANKSRKQGVHRCRRPRRPLPGMLLHLDGSSHAWFQDDRRYDLLVILDDASSEIYYAQLVEEESTATVMTALREVIERKGAFCALYSDRASHFFHNPKAGQPVDRNRLTMWLKSTAENKKADDLRSPAQKCVGVVVTSCGEGTARREGSSPTTSGWPVQASAWSCPAPGKLRTP